MSDENFSKESNLKKWAISLIIFSIFIVLYYFFNIIYFFLIAWISCFIGFLLYSDEPVTKLYQKKGLPIPLSRYDIDSFAKGIYYLITITLLLIGFAGPVLIKIYISH